MALFSVQDVIKLTVQSAVSDAQKSLSTTWSKVSGVVTGVFSEIGAFFAHVRDSIGEFLRDPFVKAKEVKQPAVMSVKVADPQEEQDGFDALIKSRNCSKSSTFNPDRFPQDEDFSALQKEMDKLRREETDASMGITGAGDDSDSD